MARNHSHTQQQDSSKLSSSTSCGPCALPPELLVYIFTFCTQASDNPSLPYPAWLPITRVCRHWRTIALSTCSLWASVTRGLSLHWIKVFMERSRPMLMDFDFLVAPLEPDTGTCLRNEDIVLLLADFTRLRSLSLTGYDYTIRPITDSLHNSPHIQSLTLCLEDTLRPFILPNNIFGGKAHIRHLQLLVRDGDGPVIAPHWLLRGVTHFTCSEPIPLSELLNVLHNMPALVYFEFRGYLSTSDKPGIPPIQMPQLMDLTVCTDSPADFILLNQLLLLPVGAKRRSELSASASVFNSNYCIDGLLPVVKAANGFQQFRFFGSQKAGWFRLWSGNATTIWEDAELCIHAEWRELGLKRVNLRYFMAFCDALGAARVRRLVIDSPSSGLSKSYWSMLLHKLPGVEELELYPASVDTWKEIGAPAMLPGLQRVRAVNSEPDRYHPTTQYLWTRRRTG